MSAEWIMVIITAVYVIATIFMCIANFMSANATKNQLEELKKQYAEDNKPYITTELIYEKRNFYGLRFTNHGRRIAENVRIDLDSQFVDCLQEDFKREIENQKGKECFIGIGQHYELFFANSGIRGKEKLMPAKGSVTYKNAGKEYKNIFEIDLKNYMSFFSVNSEEEDIKQELKKQNAHLDRISKALARIANQNEQDNDEQ